MQIIQFGRNFSLWRTIETVFRQVPRKYVKKIRIVWDNCTLEDKENKDCIDNAMKAKNAYIFDPLREDWDRMFSPMLIELKEDHDEVMFPCIYHKDGKWILFILKLYTDIVEGYEIPNSATRNIYGFTAENGFSNMNYRRTTVS